MKHFNDIVRSPGQAAWLVQNGYKNTKMIVKANKVDFTRGAISTTSWQDEDFDFFGARWPGDTDGITRSYLAIPYRFNDLGHDPANPLSHTSHEKEIIRSTMNIVSNEYMNGCIQFVDDTVDQAHYSYIEIFNAPECSSALGWEHPNGHPNEMDLDADGCLSASTIQHEFLHALGFEHEQSRPDRDDHIIVHWDYLDDDLEDQYYKMPLTHWMDTSSPYDTNSVMHYQWWMGLTSEGYEQDKSVMTDKETGEAVQNPGRERMSSEDAFQLAAMYESFCPSLPSRTCDNGQRYLSNFAW